MWMIINAVPINYSYEITDTNENGSIYFHCALEGHKLENILYNNHICFTVVDSVELLSSAFSTKYQSVVVFGTIKILNDNTEKRKGIQSILQKYSPDFYKKGLQYIDKSFDKMNVLKIDIERITGKAKL